MVVNESAGKRIGDLLGRIFLGHNYSDASFRTRREPNRFIHNRGVIRVRSRS